MIRKHSAGLTRKGLIWLAVVLAAMIPFAAYAQTAVTSNTTDMTTQTTVNTQKSGRGGNGGQFGNGLLFGNGNIDSSSLTDEQKVIYDQAVSLYEEIENQVLADLVSEGVVSQTDVDEYTTLRAAKKTLASLDMSSWTAEQYKAYYEAMQKSGDERKEALLALADAGQITQEQAVALNAQTQNSLWSTISQNAATNSDIQTAMNTMRQAYQTYREMLSSAGIISNDKGGGMRGNMPEQTGPINTPNEQSSNNSGSQQSGEPQSEQSSQNGHI